MNAKRHESNGARVCNPQPFAPSVSVSRSQFVYRDDVDRADGHCELILTNDDYDLGRQGDEITMRHRKTTPIGEAKGKRNESVFEPLFDLVNHGGTLRSSMVESKRPACPAGAVAAGSGPRRCGVGRAEGRGQELGVRR